jgi:UDP-3-O-[3-hydroxymyristoyl] glucosamine N-acyltransferase
MNILLTNATLATRTGTEIVTRDLALGLHERGHRACVFTPRPGRLADELTRRGVRVVDDPEAVPFHPDIIHGHHTIETSLACLRFPGAPAIFVCHDRLSWHDAPPRLESVRHFVAVDRNCLERLVVECLVPAEQTTLIPNAVDLGRFNPKRVLPGRPASALVFSNYATDGGRLESIRMACAAEGLTLEAAGSGVGHRWNDPERRLGDFDVVFAKGRCALEAMAAGCAVILSDRQGLGPMVRRRTVRDLREWNFGARCLQSTPDEPAIRREIAAYDAADAGEVSEFVRSHASLDLALRAYEGLYEAVVGQGPIEVTRVSVGSALEAMAREHGALESRLRLTGEKMWSAPLPPSAGAHIALRIASAPRVAAAGTEIRVGVAIENRSRETLASLRPSPVHVAYHWLEARTGRTVVFEGDRTPLDRIIPPGGRHAQLAGVTMPAEPGTYTLRVTMVQEDQFWFDALPDPVVAECDIAVHSPDAGPAAAMTLSQASELTDWEVVRDGTFANLGFLSDPMPRMLTFVEDRRFVASALAQADVSCILTSPELSALVPGPVALALTGCPRQTFFRLHNQLARRTNFYGADTPTVIDQTAEIHPRCWIDEHNVVIGPGVKVGPNATIVGRVVIGAGTVVHPGAVVGSAGFQTSRLDQDPIEMAHAGSVEIGADCHVFANAVIARGLFRQATRAGRESRIGNGAFVSHNCVLGERVFVGHGAVVNGNVRVGQNVWIGPGATLKHGITIGDGAKISLGATVARDVAGGTRVTGSLAIDHRRMLRLMAAAEKGRI